MTLEFPVFLLQMFSSYPVHYPHAAKSSPHTADASLLVLNTSFIGTTGVTFLIMKTLSSHHTLSPPITDVTLLTLYTLSTHCTAFSLYCRCDPPGTAHFLYLYCRCDIPDTADFLLTPHTLSSYYQCSPSGTVTLLTLDNFLIIYCRCDPPCTAHFLFSCHRCDLPDTTEFLLTPDTL